MTPPATARHTPPVPGVPHQQDTFSIFARNDLDVLFTTLSDMYEDRVLPTACFLEQRLILERKASPELLKNFLQIYEMLPDYKVEGLRPGEQPVRASTAEHVVVLFRRASQPLRPFVDMKILSRK